MFPVSKVLGGPGSSDEPVPLGSGQVHVRVQIPEVPRRWESTRWVSTRPIASMSAYMVVGPTNVKPSLRRALDRASDSDDFVGISATVCGVGVRSGRKDHTKSTRPSF